MAIQPSNRTRHDRSDRTQEKILRAAVREFSTQGLSGARTDRIAASAGVNKALLYYYFQSKQGLYEAALKTVATRVVEDALAAFDSKFSAGERLLRSALNHFDRILTQWEFQSLMQQEMVRFRSGKGGSLPILFKTAFRPLIEKLRETTEEGVQAGEIYPTDWLQVIYAMFGANVFYFLSAPMMELALPMKPFQPKALRLRREVAIRFLGGALFTDRAAGVKLANRILVEMPMPKAKNIQARIAGFAVGRKTYECP